MTIRDWLIPQDKVFYDLFEQQCEICVKAAAHLSYMIENFTDVKNQCHIMKSYEHSGDEIAHKIYQFLNSSFITPIEPEEITHLASGLDDIIDAIDDAVRKMFFYDIGATDKYMAESARLICQQVDQILIGIKAIRDLKDPALIDNCCIEINRLENLADDVLALSLQDIFKTNDAIKILKMKDIYETLEVTTDRCEDVANVLGDIAIRHS